MAQKERFEAGLHDLSVHEFINALFPFIDLEERRCSSHTSLIECIQEGDTRHTYIMVKIQYVCERMGRV